MKQPDTASADALSPAERKFFFRKGFTRPDWFLAYFLPEWFPTEDPADQYDPALVFPPIHLGLIAILCRQTDFLKHHSQATRDWIHENYVEEQDSGAVIEIFQKDASGELHLELGKYTEVLMPRGASKTTICNGINLWHVMYHETEFLFYLSETAPHAKTQLSNIGNKIGGSDRLRMVFGDLKPSQRGVDEDGVSRKWSESAGVLETKSGVSLAANGRGGQVRGQNRDAKRPDRIILDDVEDEEAVATDEQRRKTKKWFMGTVLPALPELNPAATIVALGTLLHPEALLMMFKDDPEWTSIKFGALDRAGEPIWPRWMDKKKLERKKTSYAIKGMLSIFYMEYHNEIRSPEDAKFKPADIIIEPVAEASVVATSIVLDPAISDEPGRDFACIAVVSMLDNGLIYVREMWGSQTALAREQIDEYFRLKILYNTTKQGIESVAFQKVLVHLMREEMFRKAKALGRQAYFEITPILHSTKVDKLRRVEGVLQPRYASGYMRHCRKFVELETQLLDWPNSKKDFPDALAMAVTLLDEFAGIAASEGDSWDKDEYEPLEENIGRWAS